MEKLIAQLLRLYLAPGAVSPERVARHLLGQEALFVQPEDGLTRTIVFPFDKAGKDGAGDAHWAALCELASVLQVECGFPAPAVSISGADGYRLWLSLEAPVALADAQQFTERLLRRHAPGFAPGPGAAAAPVPLPPCLHAASGKWAAFINPGMGASFAEEPGLELAPPLAAQAAFLEDLESIGLAQFRQALQDLAPAAAPAPSVTGSPRAPAADGLLLRDATLEDIVRHLHAKGIEPTFRHLIPTAR